MCRFFHLHFIFLLLCFISASAQEKKETPPGSAAYTTHTVQKKETLYGISKQYNVSIDTLLLLNTMLSDGLKEGQVIRVPVNNNAAASSGQQVIQDSVALQVAMDTATAALHAGMEIKIAMLLPFRLPDVKDSVEARPGVSLSINDYIGSRSLAALEFYEGALVAADSLAQQGLRIKFFVFDTGDDSLTLRRLFIKPELKNADLVLSQQMPSSLMSMLAKFAKENKVNVLSAASLPSSLLQDNPYVHSMIPGVGVQCALMASFLTSYYQGANILIVHSGATKETELSALFRQKLAKQYTGPAIKEYIFGKAGAKGILDNILSGKKNIVIVPSSNEVFVSELLNRLGNSVKEEQDIVLVGLPTWEQMQTLDIGLLQKLRAHIFTPSYADFASDTMKAFRAAYRMRYSNEPMLQSCQGYDAVFYTGVALMRTGDKSFEKFSSIQWDGLQTKFSWQRTGPHGGFENHDISVLKYHELQLIKLNR